jgi:hypothetical protein
VDDAELVEHLVAGVAAIGGGDLGEGIVGAVRPGGGVPTGSPGIEAVALLDGAGRIDGGGEGAEMVLQVVNGVFRGDSALLGEGLEGEAADAVAVLDFLDRVGEIGIGAVLGDDALVAAEVEGDFPLELVPLGDFLAAAEAGVIVEGGGGVPGGVEFGAIDLEDAGAAGEFEFLYVLVGGPDDFAVGLAIALLDGEGTVGIVVEGA